MKRAQIQIEASAALNIVRTVIPLLELGTLATPVGAGLAAAQALIPLLAKIPVGKTITIEEQAALNQRISNLLTSFQSKAWQPRTRE